jgi:tetratricopeptide (TPR) repeat protein
VCRAHKGHFPDAEGDFLLSEGSAYYEQSAISWHAETLRALGYGREAAALRLSQVAAGEGSASELITYVYASEDLLSAGDVEGALDVTERALSMHPRSGVAMTAYAEALTAAGRLDEAGSWLWLAALRNDLALRDTLAQARYAIASGDLPYAEELVDGDRRHMMRNWQMATLLADIYVAQERPEEALVVLDRAQWRNSERPEFLRVDILAGLAAGDLELARESCERAASYYPNNLRIQAAMAVYEQKVGKSCAIVKEPWSLPPSIAAVQTKGAGAP